MAIYEYKCKKCGEVFEIYKGMNETIEVKCPKCKSSETMRVFFPPRTIKNKNDVLNSYGSEMSSSGCDTCTSGVCTNCSNK